MSIDINDNTNTNTFPLVPGTVSDTSSIDVVEGVVPSADVSNGVPTSIPSEPFGGPDILHVAGSAPAAGCDRILDGTSVGVAPIPVSASDASIGAVPLSVSFSRDVLGPSSIGPTSSSIFVGLSLGIGLLALDSLDWQVEVAKVEEGWISVKTKHSERSSPSFDMTLRS